MEGISVKKKSTIEVSGARFSADEVEEVTIKRDGREIRISQRDDDQPQIGFRMPQDGSTD